MRDSILVTGKTLLKSDKQDGRSLVNWTKAPDKWGRNVTLSLYWPVCLLVSLPWCIEKGIMVSIPGINDCKRGDLRSGCSVSTFFLPQFYFGLDRPITQTRSFSWSNSGRSSFSTLVAQTACGISKMDLIYQGAGGSAWVNVNRFLRVHMLSWSRSFPLVKETNTTYLLKKINHSWSCQITDPSPISLLLTKILKK